MKKTFITVLALCGAAFAADDMLWTVSTAESRTESFGQDVANGFIMKLSDNFLTSTAPSSVQELTLKSVTLSCTTDGGSHADSAKMVIFQRPGADRIGKFIAISDDAVTFTAGSSSSMTFTFDNLEVILDKDTQYQYFFVTADTTADAFSATGENGDAYAAVKASFRFDRVKCGEYGNYLPTGDGITWGPFNGWSGQNNALVTFGVTPEPATTTLSLLALAGLAARRKRH